MAADPLEAWRRRGHSRRLGGRGVFVVDTPSREPAVGVVLCLHGFPSASWDFSEIWEPLTRRHRAIALDFLGFGLSDKPRGHRYSIAEQADLVEELERVLGLERFHVLAHDYGDTVAQELLARQLARPRPSWRSLCLLNGGLFPEAHRARPIQRLMAGPLGPLIARLSSKRRFSSSLSSVFGAETQPTPEQIDVLWQLLEHNGGRAALPGLLGYMEERRRHRARWVGALRDTEVPLSVINGSADPVSGAHMVARFREVVGGTRARIVEFPRVGHYPQLEVPDVVAREYLTFVEHVEESERGTNARA